MATAERHFLIHWGKATLTIPPVTHSEIDPETGEEHVVVDEKERTEKIALPKGVTFGGNPILVPVEVPDKKRRDALLAKGYEVYSAKKGKAGDEKSEQDHEALAEEQREKALANQKVVPPVGETGKEK